jgi:sulfur-carrier protein adenylyltransferase/sulfurtransferase
MTMTTSVPESVYYARHFRLPNFDEKTQLKLRDARVLIVGVGGLGCPAALYLASAGVGTISLCDADDVSATNLHRQVLFDCTCIGQKKVDVAAARLKAVNPHIQIQKFPQFANAQLLADLVGCHDLVLDGTDNFSAKYAISDACEAASVPMVYGSIFQFEGQVSVFHCATAEHPQGLSYRDLYAEAPPPGLTQNCGEAGVIGVLPGIIGAMQANEAIKVLTGLGESLSGQLLTFDALCALTRRLRLTKRDRSASGTVADEIAYEEWLQLQNSSAPPMLLDVRELKERQAVSLGGVHIPLATLPKRLADLSTGHGIVVYCKSGVRSAKAAMYLRSVLPGVKVSIVKGGVDACVGAVMACTA